MAEYSIRVKIGASEFEAEGPVETVKEAYDGFLRAVATTPAAAPPNPPASQIRQELPLDGRTAENPGAEELATEILNRAFKVDRDKGVVSLKVHPQSEGDQRLADAVILLIYGQDKLLEQDQAPVTKLNDGIRQSGLPVKRMDRYLSVHKGLYMKGGQRSGSKYSLTNTGEKWAVDTLTSMFAKG